MNRVDRLTVKLKHHGAKGSAIIFISRNDSGKWTSDIIPGKEYDEEDEAIADVKKVIEKRYEDAMIIIDDCDQ